MTEFDDHAAEYEPEVDGDYKTRLLLSKKDLDRMRETVEQWQADPAKILEWADDQSKMALLILSHIMTHPRGRSGPYHSMRAADSIAKMIDAIVRLKEVTEDERIQGAKATLDRPMGESGDGQSEHRVEGEDPGRPSCEVDVPDNETGEVLGLADVEGPRYGATTHLDEGRTRPEEPDEAVS